MTIIVDELEPSPKPTSLALAEARGALALPDHEAVNARILEYIAHARAPNTFRAYAADWKGFVRWCRRDGVDPESADGPIIARYLTTLDLLKRSPRTITRAYSGIAFRFRMLGHERRRPPEEVAMVLSAMARMRQQPPVQKAAITEPELRRMLATCPDDLFGRRDRAVLLLGWWGAFRRSELVALDVGDLTWSDDGIRVLLRHSKTDQTGQGTRKPIPHAHDVAMCAVTALRRWLEAAGIADGALFRPFGAGGALPRRIGSDQVGVIVKRAAKAAGLDADRYGAHSLRSGFATTAAQKGKSLQSIMRQTKHKQTKTVLGYIQDANLFDDSATKDLL